MDDDELIRAAKDVLARKRPRVAVTSAEREQLLRELGHTEHNVLELADLEVTD